MTRTRYLLLALVLLALPASGCHSNGEECDTCTADDQCKSGLYCMKFDDGSQRCGSGVGATTCRVAAGGRAVSRGTARR